MQGKRSEAALTYRAWYGTSKWKALRANQLKAEPHCRFCLEAGHTVRATVVDHVQRHGGDPVRFWSGPFQSLCKPHHDASKQREEAGGFSRAVGDDGWPVDPKHPGNGGILLRPQGGTVSVAYQRGVHRLGSRTLQRSPKKDF
jgi:5-methylcytosine-specific restriction protein A